MSATPIKPGRAYRIKHQGKAITVLATNPVAAILTYLETCNVL